MRQVQLFIAIATCAVLAAGAPALSQTQVGIPFEDQKGFILELSPEERTVVFELGDNQLSRQSAIEMELAEGARMIASNGESLALEDLRTGLEVEISGQRFGRRLSVDEIRLVTKLEGDDGRFRGVYEKLDGEVAVIGGRLVVLEAGAEIEGTKEWKGMSFASFDDMMLGSFVKVEGVRGSDGLIRASAGETWPNTYTEADEEVRAAVRQGLTLPPANRLSGGRVEMAGQEYRLVEDLDLQRYVTEVGYRLVPDYLQAVPDEDPGKLVFRFYVIEDPSFNAFAYADGSVFVHTGLLGVIENEAQLAAVLGHEIAHVTHEHGRRQFKAQKRIETGKKVAQVAGKVAGMLGKSNPFNKKKEVLGREVDLEGAIDFGTGLFSNIYSREMENQADGVGLFYMHEAGYDPREAPKVWRTIVDQTAGHNRIEEAQDRVQTFLYSSHPAAKRRLSNLNRELALSWHDTDIDGVEVGRERFREVVVSQRK